MTGSSTNGYKDIYGSFSDARLASPHGLQWIGYNSYRIADIYTSSIRYADLETQTLSTLNLCNNTLCTTIYDPVSFMLTNSSLYFGEYGKILLFECECLKASQVQFIN